MNTLPFSKRRIDELDGLRGIAALCVVFYHYTYRFYEKFTITIPHHSFAYGKYGVELFFIISGFVIFMSVAKVRSAFEFIYKRFVRLYPTFWVSMILTFIVITINGNDIMKVSIKEFIINFSMLPSVFDIKSVDGVYWTLKVEMFFYGFMLLLILLRKTKLILWLGGAYILGGLILFIIPKLNEYYYYGTLFLIGINFYKIWDKEGSFINHIQIVLCVVLSLFMNLEVFCVTAFMTMIFYLFVYQKLKFLASSPLLFLGKISYALYLVHQNIGYTVQLGLINYGIQNQVILILLPLILSFIISSIITLLIEKPIAAKLNKYYKLKLAAEQKPSLI